MNHCDGAACPRPFATSRRRFMQSAAFGAAALMGPLGAGPLTTSAQEATPAPGTPEATGGDPPAPSIVLSPQPGSSTAFPGTNISFRGVSADTLGDVFVSAEESGAHSGVVVDHLDGRGCSFLLDDEFRPGERVTVRAGIPLTGSPDGVHAFTIALPAPRARAQTEYVIDDPEAGLNRMHHWVTEPRFLAPELTITDDSPEATPGLIFLTPSGPGAQSSAMIVDERGEPVWYTTPAQPFYQIYCLKVQPYRGLPALVYAESAKTIGYGFGHWVILNEQYERVAFVRAGNGIPGLDVHDILLTPYGSAWSIAYAPVYQDLSGLGGHPESIVLDGVIQEIDIETGIVLFEWHSLDHIEVSESDRNPPDDPETPFDYIHINSLAFDTDGHLLLSGRNTHAAYKISLITGEVIWRLGGTRSDFEMGPGADFYFAHDVQRQPDGTISLFDNHSEKQSENGTVASRALFLDLDENEMTASVAREIIHPTEILSVTQANVQVLEDGNVFIGWGSAPVFSEFSPDGELLFNGRFPPSMQSYRAYRHEWHARPTAAPVVVAKRDSGTEIELAVSWNGATDVVVWQVLAGSGPNSLEEIARADRTGFETRFTVESDAAMLRVQALDGNGAIIGGSEPVILNSE
jgi:hypothetical protein